MVDTNAFSDRIYEAAVVSEYWPLVLRELADAAEARDALLIAINNSGGGSRDLIFAIGSTVEFQAMCMRHYDYESGRERTRRLVTLQRSGFVTDWDVFTDADMLRQLVFTELLIPAGYGGGIATAINVPTGDSLIFHAERPFSLGPYQQGDVRHLDAFRPHLARAALLSARLGAERAKAAAAALESVGLPAAVLSDRGRVVALNGLLAAMVPTVIQDRSSRLMLTDANADKLLATSLEALRLSADNHAVCSIPIAAGEQHPPIIVHLVPVKGAANDIFVRSSIIVVATPVVPKEVPGATVLQALFDLTPAEARVAHELGGGRTATEIAESFSISVTTIRNQIAAVLEKSGLNRQVDLVSLLRGSGIPTKPR